MFQLHHRSTTILLALIFCLSLFLRLYKLDLYPPHLNWDEVSLGYNTYSILKTGQDEWGIRFPLIFRAFGDYKLPLYVYLSTIPIGILGLNTLSVKLISIIAGSLLPLITFFILRQGRLSTRHSLIGSLLVCLSPPLIHLSRIALEANLALTIFAASLIFLQRKHWPLTFFLLTLTALTYNSYRIISPLLISFLIILSRKSLLRFPLYLYLPSLILLAITLWQLLNPEGTSRYLWVSLLDQGAINHLNYIQQHYPRAIANKLTYYIFLVISNFVRQIDPRYLFWQGASHYQFNIPFFPLIHPLILPFYTFGLYCLYRLRHQFWPKTLLFILIISLIPSAITRDSPHILRGLVFLYLSLLVSLYGFSFVSQIKSRFLKFFGPLVFLLAICLHFVLYLRAIPDYVVKYASSWQYGYQQVISYLKSSTTPDQKIYFSKRYGEPHQYLNFFWPVSPADFQSDSKLWDYHANWYWVNGFANFTFYNDWQVADILPSLSPGSVLVASPDNPHPSRQPDQIFYFPNRQPVFYLYQL